MRYLQGIITWIDTLESESCWVRKIRQILDICPQQHGTLIVD